MSISSDVNENKTALKVAIPPTRHDILHPCDLVEDVAVAYEFNRIEKKMPTSMTIGDQVCLSFFYSVLPLTSLFLVCH